MNFKQDCNKIAQQIYQNETKYYRIQLVMRILQYQKNNFKKSNSMEGKIKKIQGYSIFLDKKLGEGAFGKVYLAEGDTNKQKYAVKMLDRKIVDRDQYLKNAVFSQIDILQTLKSPNVVGFIQVLESPHFYYIVQEYCDGGDLSGLIKKKKIFTESEAIDMLKQIANGFVQLIKQGIIHRDLKPQNVLISKGVLKLADFGLSKKIQNQRAKNKTMCGTPLYMSLQILKGKPYTSKCDIWALGLMFYEFLVGRTPWTGYSQYELMNNIETKPPVIPNNLSPNTITFIKGCLQVHEDNRFSWEQVLKQPIFNNYFCKNLDVKNFEDKFKAIINKLKFKIQSQNIDLERLFKDKGYKKNSVLTYKDFEAFIMTIEPNCAECEKKYMFQQLDTDKSNTVSFGELEAALLKYKVNMRSKMVDIVRKDSKDSLEEIEHKRKLTEKIYNALQKLVRAMRSAKLKLNDFYNHYNIEKNGKLTVPEFQKFMSRLDNTFTKDQTNILFALIDYDTSGTISFEEFHLYFCKITGEPYHNFMNQQNNLFADQHKNGNGNGNGW